MKAAITGATGFVGGRLRALIEGAGGRPEESVRTVSRDPSKGYTWDRLAEAFRGVDAVFHLAGESVGEGRWTEAKKRAIRESRVETTRKVVEAIAALPEEERPKALVTASAIGYYGDRGDDLLDESAPPGADFLAEVCVAWEAEAKKAPVRTVMARIGLVLGREGGALPRMLLPFRLGLGGRLGSGRQWMSWIHVEDLARLLAFAAERAELRGPLNAVSPNPVTNREFTRALAAALGRPAILPVPRLALRIAVGEFANHLLTSQRCVPRAAKEAGFEWRYPDLRAALAEILAAPVAAA